MGLESLDVQWLAGFSFALNASRVVALKILLGNVLRLCYLPMRPFDTVRIIRVLALEMLSKVLGRKISARQL